MDAGVLADETAGFGSLARLLVDKGLQHEAECLAEYRRRDLDVFEVPTRRTGESFSDWVDRVGNPLDSGHQVDLPDAVHPPWSPRGRRLPGAGR